MMQATATAFRIASRRQVSKKLAASRCSNNAIRSNNRPAITSTLDSSSIIISRPSFFEFSSTTSNNKQEEQEQAVDDKETTKNDDNDEGSSLRDSVNRIKNEDESKNQSSDSSSSDGGMFASNDIFRKAADQFDIFKASVHETWEELLQSGAAKDINKKIYPTETVERAGGDEELTKNVAIMVIDPSEHLTAWERMQRRLTEAPIIQNLLERSNEVYEKSGAKKVKEKIDHIKEDANEAWETSQNPWVYRASSVYDTLTAESEFTVAVRELRKLDPEFTLEEWRHDVVEHTLPQIMKWFLEGRIQQLEPWLGESVFKRISAEIKARKSEGLQIDTHVLAIMNSEILACELDTVEKGSPIIMLHFMCQQINCVRKKDDPDDIVEGSEDDIRANSYIMAFQREFDEEKGELNWKIIDFRFNGAIAYL